MVGVRTFRNMFKNMHQWYFLVIFTAFLFVGCSSCSPIYVSQLAGARL